MALYLRSNQSSKIFQSVHGLRLTSTRAWLNQGLISGDPTDQSFNLPARSSRRFGRRFVRDAQATPKLLKPLAVNFLIYIEDILYRVITTDRLQKPGSPGLTERIFYSLFHYFSITTRNRYCASEHQVTFEIKDHGHNGAFRQTIILINHISVGSKGCKECPLCGTAEDEFSTFKDQTYTHRFPVRKQGFHFVWGLVILSPSPAGVDRPTSLIRPQRFC